MTALSSVAISAYTDLVRLLKDDALSGVEGKPTLKQRGDKAYWYAARRVGNEMRFIYIGEDTNETRAGSIASTTCARLRRSDRRNGPGLSGFCTRKG